MRMLGSFHSRTVQKLPPEAAVADACSPRSNGLRDVAPESQLA